MNLYTLMPEVSGELGKRTVIDTKVHPPEVKSLHFVFSGWLGDDIIECFPCFLVSEKLKNRLQQANFTGYSIKDCEIEISEEFSLTQPTVILPKFYWIDIKGNESDDFFINEKYNLNVKQNVYKILESFNLNNCDIERSKI